MIIYLVKNLVNQKGYVGLTKRGLGVRKSEHLSDARLGRKASALHRAIKKYGEASFEFREIARASDFDGLKELERSLIDRLETHVSKRGYNVTFGGDGMDGYTPSTETRRKLSEANRGRRQSPEARALMSQRWGHGDPAAWSKRMVESRRRKDPSWGIKCRTPRTPTVAPFIQAARDACGPTHLIGDNAYTAPSGRTYCRDCVRRAQKRHAEKRRARSPE